MLVGVRKGLIGNTPTIPHSPATILCSDAMSEPNQPNPQQRPRRRIRINVSVVWSTVRECPKNGVTDHGVSWLWWERYDLRR